MTLGPQPAGDTLKKRQLEYDGLGRITSVCEITTASGSGPCGQSTSATGFKTSYTYNALGNIKTVTQGAQTRTFQYDLLGRMTTEMTPEGGTVNYTYDTDAVCGTSKGDLVKKVDAVGNTTCYHRDTLHRVTSITYSGPYAANTPTKTLIYDSATVNGVVMKNAAGRLAEAYTGNFVTDLGFSYTKPGRIGSAYEKTPHSNGYYEVDMGYFPNGALSSLAGNIGLPTINYHVDGEGRADTVTSSAGLNPVTDTQYNEAGQVTSVTFGSSDIAKFQYVAVGGNMSKYEEDINGTAVFGSLGWNQNGTLRSLVITDPFNTADNQSCTYLYDELGRVGTPVGSTAKSVDCGTAWQQTFTYDQYGNITKSGSVSWMPGYTASNNRYALAGTSYDANGNLTADTFYNYTLDVAGHHVVVGANTLVFDALGREVEKAQGGGYTSFVYIGKYKLALMNGLSLSKGMVPLSGGTQVRYNPGNAVIDFRVPDWLGSYRIASTSARAYEASVVRQTD